MRNPRRGEPLPAGPLRRLFLDDDPERAALFLAEYPDAVWVETVPTCLERLAEPWDEVHLDHDLGGEQYVDLLRDDCGMEVVRWLEAEPRPHLRTTQFFVHSHNAVAAYFMTLQMKTLGLRVATYPFGLGRWKAPTPPPPGLLRRLLGRWLGSGRGDTPGPIRPGRHDGDGDARCQAVGRSGMVGASRGGGPSRLRSAERIGGSFLENGDHRRGRLRGLAPLRAVPRRRA